MATIEGRAIAFAEEQNDCDNCYGKGIYCPCYKFTADHDMYLKIATEQHEIDIKAVQKYYCDELCHLNKVFGICPLKSKSKCDTFNKIHKLVEGEV